MDKLWPVSLAAVFVTASLGIAEAGRCMRVPARILQSFQCPSAVLSNAGWLAATSLIRDGVIIHSVRTILSRDME
jgi:hypothetical protein